MAAQGATSMFIGPRDTARSLETWMEDATMPARLVLATDMSARCDRALSRAAQLARAWGAAVEVLHAVSPAEAAFRDRGPAPPAWRRPEPWVRTVERRLQEDLAAEGIDATVRVVTDAPAQAVLAAVAGDPAALVVLGIAKDAHMERLQLGSTADSLVRHATVPVLNVRSRARAPYKHVVTATDFSAPSVHALQLAARWFPQARLTAFHACLPSDPAVLDGLPASEARWRPAVTAQFETFLTAAGLTGPAARPVQCLAEAGPPAALLAGYVVSGQVDLIVLGSHGRSGMARALLGSTAEDLLHALDCDTLVVRGSA
jgi:nucleotide-binding universal stress UspA family protein